MNSGAFPDVLQREKVGAPGWTRSPKCGSARYMGTAPLVCEQNTLKLATWGDCMSL